MKFCGRLMTLLTLFLPAAGWAQVLSMPSLDVQVVRSKKDRNVVDVFTPADARAIFDWLKTDSRIDFKMNRDGCYARAHQMVLDLRARGFQVEKVLITGPGLKPIGFEDEDLYWVYHIAPAIYVEVEGREEIRVLDPGLANEPLALPEWVRLVNPTEHYRLRLVPWRKYQPGLFQPSQARAALNTLWTLKRNQMGLY